MIKRLSATVFLVLFCCTVSAQHQDAVMTSSDTTKVRLFDKLAEEFGKDEDVAFLFRNNDHWFIDILAGGGFYCAEQNRFAQNAFGRFKPQFQVGLGRWVHPAWALRLSVGGGWFAGDYLPIVAWNMFDPVDHKTVPSVAKQYFYTDKNGWEWFRREFSYMDAQMDVIFDLTRAFTSSTTPLDLYLYTGPGFGFSFPSQGFNYSSSLAFKLGTELDVHLTEKLGLKFKIEGTVVDESFDGQINGTTSAFNRTVEGFATAMVGLSIRLGHSKSNKYTMINPTVVERAYKMMPAAAPIPIVETDEFKVPFVVRFYIDQYNIEPDQELNITKVCTYLQDHPNARLLMTGHCDPETANPIYNQALSERRCKSVLKYIDEHFNIDRSRIDVKPMGDTQRNFDEDFRWNRCVILTILED